MAQSQSFRQQEEFLQLFNRYKPIVFKLQKKYRLNNFDNDDWLQEGQIVFYKILTCYDVEKGATLGHFFKLAFVNHINSLLRKQTALKRKADVLSCSLEKLAPVDEANYRKGMNYQPHILENMILKENFQKYQTLFSEREGAVMSCYLLQMDLAEIAQLLHISENQVRNALDRGKKKLTDHLVENRE
ncbi:RNA polymerase sporulation-specific sigma factor [Enterococcus sp. PF1-24]|uniref:sigma-70 family RNA polymerase sigma factor n=1 Tax=unclassified Enterococcus TaxID=2608891 RepID=UPI00247641F0|nr:MULTISPECIES: sigma-70 family RNA polymerase sigma factor [unclassified Enterococcus]MDH6364018.1 RNA polymerase sporulation-specific sigma factor [Enterococcus sp. PFB1-1]MDH6401119.1 RNA polymerase sporulation-specific sigma factor [Enterococcus sp. PF1-24]